MNEEHRRIVSWVLLFLFVLAVDLRSADGAKGQGGLLSDRWFVVLLGQDRAGYARESVRERGDELVMNMELHVELRRGPYTVRLDQITRFVESRDGRPLTATSTMNLGMGPATTTYYRFLPEGIEKRVGTAGMVQPLPPVEGDWLPPVAAARYVDRQIAERARTISYRTIDVSMHPVAHELKMTIVGEQDIEVFGKVVPAIKWEVTDSLLPHLTTDEYVDGHGRPLKAMVNLPGGIEFTMLAADEQLAKGELDPPEIMASSLIHPDRPIDQPRRLRTAVYELSIRGGYAASVLELPRSGYQKVVWGDQRSVRVVVDLQQPVNPVDDLPTDEHLSASTMLDHQDEKVRSLLAEALGDGPDDQSDRQKAERLREFVDRYVVEKDLSVGFGSAGEVARTAQGDCTEHAVLLAAMLRAKGIPSRTVSGLIYVDQFLNQSGVFGYHMWTQAWLDDGPLGQGSGGGRWVDLDATLRGQAFDAAHIALSVSALSDETLMNDLVQLLPLLGTLEVKIVVPQATGTTVAP